MKRPAEDADGMPRTAIAKLVRLVGSGAPVLFIVFPFRCRPALWNPIEDFGIQFR
jgi:hypothetical protein